MKTIEINETYDGDESGTDAKGDQKTDQSTGPNLGKGSAWDQLTAFNGSSRKTYLNTHSSDNALKLVRTTNIGVIGHSALDCSVAILVFDCPCGCQSTRCHQLFYERQ